MVIALGVCAVTIVVGAALVVMDRRGASGTSRASRGTSHEPDRRRDRWSAALVAGALLWVVVAVLALFFVPMVAEGSLTESSGGGEPVWSRETRPLIDAGLGVEIAAVVVAVGVVALALRFGRPPRSVLFVLGYVSLGFCVISAASIGILFIPVPLLLLVSAGLAEAGPRSRKGFTWLEAGRQSPAIRGRRASAAVRLGNRSGCVPVDQRRDR